MCSDANEQESKGAWLQLYDDVAVENGGLMIEPRYPVEHQIRLDMRFECLSIAGNLFVYYTSLYIESAFGN